MADLYFFMRKTEFAVEGGIIKNTLLINCHVFFLKKHLLHIMKQECGFGVSASHEINDSVRGKCCNRGTH